VEEFENEVGLPSAEEERELLAKIRTGDLRARKRAVLSNVGLVRKWAHHYKYFGVPLEDLIQEGHRGLMHAIDCFIPNGEARLSTYATWWIRHYIRQAIARQARPFHMPVPIVESLRRLRLTATLLQERLNREPSNLELAREMGCSITHVQTLKNVNGVALSLQQDGEPTDDEWGYMADQLTDTNQATPLEYLLKATLRDDVECWLKTLSKRESKILSMRFGLNGEEAHTFEEIGKHLSLNRERVRQLAQGALEKLRKML
jgi:RNA polymerase primary sigma factor